MNDPVTRLQDLPDEVFYCLRGAEGHFMQEYHDIEKRNEWGQPVDYQCTKCRKKRRDIYDANGHLSVREYDPRRGYPGFPNIEAHETADVRREVVRRARKRAMRARAS